MANSYYNHATFPATGSAATSASMRAELNLISQGFDRLPTLAGNAGKLIVVNSTGTALEPATFVPDLTVLDSAFIVQDNVDATKKFRFEASTVTPGQTRVFTVPDANTVLVGTDTTQTLLNKTLTAPVIATIVNTGTLTLPTSTDTLVGRATTDTLTNKTINLSSNTLTATSAQIAAAVTDETGTGSLVFSNSPALVTPDLGTPSALTLTNATGLPTAGLVDNSVTNEKLRDSAGLSVIGRATNTTGDPADIAAGSDHQVLRRSGTSIGFGAINLAQSNAVTGVLPVVNGGTGQSSYTNGELLIGNSTGNTLTKATLTQGSGIAITNGSGSITIGVATNSISDSLLRDSAGLSVIGRATNTTGDPADITAGTDHQVLRRSGTSIGFGAVDLGQSAAITGRLPYANLAQGSGLSVLGVTGNATADNASIVAGTDHQVLRRSGTSVGFGAVALNQAAAVTGTLPVANGGTGITSFGTGVATFLGTPSSANLAAAVTDETGTGALVFGTNPTISGATISGGSINNTPIGGTTPAAGTFSTITAANGIYTAKSTATVDQTIPSGSNALSVAPFTVASGVTITVPSGSTWAIV